MNDILVLIKMMIALNFVCIALFVIIIIALIRDKS